MPVPRNPLTLFLAVAALGAAAPGCSTDDAAERDAKDAGEQIDKEAGNNDEQAGREAKEAGEDAAREADKAAEDIDGN